MSPLFKGYWTLMAMRSQFKKKKNSHNCLPNKINTKKKKKNPKRSY